MAMNVITLRYGSNLSGMKKLILVIGALGLFEPGRTHAQVVEPIWVFRSAVDPSSYSRSRSIECDGSADHFILDVVIPQPLQGHGLALVTKVDGLGQEVWRDTLLAGSLDAQCDLVIDEVGNIIAAGILDGFDTLRIRKYDAAGTVLWNQDLAHDGLQSFDVEMATIPGRVYIALTSATDTTGRDLVVLCLDALGAPIWERRYSASSITNYEFLAQMALDGQGRAYVTGYSQDTVQGSMVVLALALDGSIRWVERAAPGQTVFGTHIGCSMNGRVIALGQIMQSGLADGDLLLTCYDTLGSLLWDQQLSIGGVDLPMDLSIASDGTVFCIGTGTAADGSKDLGAFGISASGTLLWSHVVDDGPLEVLGSGIAAEAGGSCVLVGTRADPMQGGRSAIFTQRLDPSGQPLWSDLYTTPNEGHSGAHDVVVDPSGDILVHGQMRDTTISDEILVLKYAQETGLSEEGSTGSFMVAWPNPATDRVQVTYPGLHAGSRLRLTDTLGRVVAWGRSGMPHLELVALTPGLYDLACVDARGMVMARCPLVIGSH